MSLENFDDNEDVELDEYGEKKKKPFSVWMMIS